MDGCNATLELIGAWAWLEVAVVKAPTPNTIASWNRDTITARPTVSPSAASPSRCLDAIERKAAFVDCISQLLSACGVFGRQGDVHPAAAQIDLDVLDTFDSFQLPLDVYNAASVLRRPRSTEAAAGG